MVIKSDRVCVHNDFCIYTQETIILNIYNQIAVCVTVTYSYIDNVQVW